MKASGATAAEVAKFLLETAPPTAHVRLRLADCDAVVWTNDAKLAQRLTAYWRAFVAPEAAAARDALEVFALELPDIAMECAFRPFPPAPGKSRIKDEYFDFADGRVTRKPATGMLALLSQSHQIVFGPSLNNLNQVINFLNNRYMQRLADAGYLVCHAAAFARGGRGAMLAGLSGRGKSTLTLKMLGRGFDFVSNDRVLVRRDAGRLRLAGIPKSPRVNPGTLLNEPRLRAALSAPDIERLSALSRDALWALEEKHDVDVMSAFPGCAFRLSASAGAVLLLAWDRDSSAPPVFERVTLAAQPNLLAALTKSVGPHYFTRPGAPAPPIDDAAYLAAIDDCPVYVIRGGVDFDAAAAEIERILASP